MLAPIGWRAPRSRWYAAKTLAAVGVILSVGAAIPLVSTSLPAMILSALLFGAAMFTAPTAVTDLVKTSLPKTAWGPAVAVFTVVFCDRPGDRSGPVRMARGRHAVALHAGLAGSVDHSAGSECGCHVPAGKQRRTNIVTPSDHALPGHDA